MKRVGRKDVDHVFVGPPERFADLYFGAYNLSTITHFVEVKRVGGRDVDHFLLGPPERFATLNCGAYSAKYKWSFRRGETRGEERRRLWGLTPKVKMVISSR